MRQRNLQRHFEIFKDLLHLRKKVFTHYMTPYHELITALKRDQQKSDEVQIYLTLEVEWFEN